MRLMRIGAAGAERPVVCDDDGNAYDLSSITTDIDGAFLGADGVERARAALAGGALPRVDLAGQRIGAPVARPGAVICIGQNYAAHAAESGSEPPTVPIIFFKTPNTVVGPYDDVRIPRGSSKTDWEVELAVVIGRTARYLDSHADADACIAGYAVSNDVSERDFQMAQSGGQWSKGKCCETFNPLGPWLVPAADVADPQALDLSSRVNGEQRQNSNTKDMIFGVRELVWHLSQYLVLEPGDVINTGTPQGVALSGRFPYLAAGDVMELEISGLGRQRQRLVNA
ncbi:fumarylacetoacetate hydrolase family protein [Planosporangium mesophilum]|uniref:2-hydroxyhepta-2,4-diene-1,7-dioate isomerase n=1 Tax=Planosporangium mesophilum TaxID=689768 RepID=A0A8J3X2S7_9ACTN|nr:fumarylacetoacetate hydrolase family protein [Planosporangium mesophilum]NJC82945.1 fumarylacetoacetate hydrolase family protein [Planosporangium mesophilum]GII24724.1 2-hydroxyhepta-2,4-diene-1,7-dioate isomerase [Planosporangium mesophilum]